MAYRLEKNASAMRPEFVLIVYRIAAVPDAHTVYLYVRRPESAVT
jgi:hypothetical protein